GFVVQLPGPLDHRLGVVPGGVELGRLLAVPLSREAQQRWEAGEVVDRNEPGLLFPDAGETRKPLDINNQDLAVALLLGVGHLDEAHQRSRSLAAQRPLACLLRVWSLMSSGLSGSAARRSDSSV